MHNSNSEFRFQLDRWGGIIPFSTKPGNTFFFPLIIFFYFSPQNDFVVIEKPKSIRWLLF